MFGIILPGRPVVVPPLIQTISPTQFAYTFPASPSFSHLVLFLLPGNELPSEALAGVYIQFPAPAGSSQPNAFKLLGALSANKPTAVFRVSGTVGSGGGSGSNVLGEVNGLPEVDMDADEGSPSNSGEGQSAGEVTVGISIEPAATLAPQLAASRMAAGTSAANPTDQSNNAIASFKQPQAAAASEVSTKILAQRIIKNAFNYLASFVGNDGKVPLKSFEDWWRKFERKIEVDPSFLERDE